MGPIMAKLTTHGCPHILHFWWLADLDLEQPVQENCLPCWTAAAFATLASCPSTSPVAAAGLGVQILHPRLCRRLRLAEATSAENRRDVRLDLLLILIGLLVLGGKLSAFSMALALAGAEVLSCLVAVLLVIGGVIIGDAVTQIALEWVLSHEVLTVGRTHKRSATFEGHLLPNFAFGWLTRGLLPRKGSFIL